VLGLNRAALAEGLGFARGCGLDLRTTLAVLASGAAYSTVMDAKGEKMIAADFTPEAKLAQHLKDVQLIRAAGTKAGAALPLSELHERLLADLVERGFGECDNSAIMKAFGGTEETA
jgi:3-hydroxyisobutyrate dehydrogenase-like beta-hydroxyacid dehydrogenase